MNGQCMRIDFNKTLKMVLFLGLFLAISVIIIQYSSIKFSFREPNPIASIKKEQWQKMEHEVASWADALGRGIDSGIKNTVIVLNLLGFKTEQSCEGHSDGGEAYPWVSIITQDDEIDALRTNISSIYRQIEEKRSKIESKYPNIPLAEAFSKYEKDNPEDLQKLKALYKESHLINGNIKKLLQLKVLPLRNLIFDFYKKRLINPDTMIVISESTGDSFKLYSIGGDWQAARNENEKIKKLLEYQQEMKIFTDFLTKYYFEQQ